MRAAKVLTVNAIASGLIGLGCVLDAHLLAPALLEAPTPAAVLALRVLGVGLTIFAVAVGLVSGYVLGAPDRGMAGSGEERGHEQRDGDE